MSLLDQIREPVENHMRRYEEHLRSMFVRATPELEPIASQILSRRGKSIRPLIILLCAELFPESEERNERSNTGAVLMEMVHTASLIHDDIVDQAYVRRSAPSVNALWGDKMAVLVGDFMISKAFDVGLSSGHYDIVSMINDSLIHVCEGELLQSMQSYSLTMTREIYLDIISKKTGLLISASAAIGAMSAHASEDDVEAMRSYGSNLGIAFQMRDDVLDYAPQSQTGKPACGDLRERKINMPLLWVLENSTASEKRGIIKKLSDVRNKPRNVDYLHDLIHERDAVGATDRIMGEYIDATVKSLERYPQSPAKESLVMLCDYVAKRDK